MEEQAWMDRVKGERLGGDEAVTRDPPPSG
jgi:hypothetical protein